MGETQDYDVLGFIYEYLISMFAANAGKKAGEFYTPHEVSQLMSEIVAEHLKDRESIQIYEMIIPLSIQFKRAKSLDITVLLVSRRVIYSDPKKLD